MSWDLIKLDGLKIDDYGPLFKGNNFYELVDKGVEMLSWEEEIEEDESKLSANLLNSFEFLRIIYLGLLIISFYFSRNWDFGNCCDSYWLNY